MLGFDDPLAQWSELWRFPGLTGLLGGERPAEGWSAWELCRALLEGEEEASPAGARRVYAKALDELRFDDARNFLENLGFCQLLGEPVQKLAERIEQRHADTRREIEDRLKRLRQEARSLTISLLDFNRHAEAVEKAVANGRFRVANDELEKTEAALTECQHREEKTLIPDASQVNEDIVRMVRQALAEGRLGLAQVIVERRQPALQPEPRPLLVRELRGGETWRQIVRGLLGHEHLSPLVANRWAKGGTDDRAHALLTLLLRVQENGVAAMDAEFVSRLIGAIGACFGRQSLDDNAATVRVTGVNGGFLCTTAAPDWLRLAAFLVDDEGNLTIFLPSQDVRPDDLAPARVCVDVFGGSLPRGAQGVGFLGIGDLLAHLGAEDRAYNLARTLALQAEPRGILAEDAPARRREHSRATRLLASAAELDGCDPWSRLSDEEMRRAARRFLARLGIDVIGYDFELMMYLSSQRPIIFYRLLHHAILRNFFQASRQVSGHSVFRNIMAKERVITDGVVVALEEAGIDPDTAKVIIAMLDEHALDGSDLDSKWLPAARMEAALSKCGLNPSEAVSHLVHAGLIDEGNSAYRAAENGIVEWIRNS
jgi:hypothetical protein